ncbi:MAG: hypothetical protein ABSG74_03355 [Candidatus Bathyarchaeia archaeon]|jgi:hypothetical protein
MPRRKPTVLIDTSILISGPIFLKGNEDKMTSSVKRDIDVRPEVRRRSEQLRTRRTAWNRRSHTIYTYTRV